MRCRFVFDSRRGGVISGGPQILIGGYDADRVAMQPMAADTIGLVERTCV